MKPAIRIGILSIAITLFINITRKKIHFLLRNSEIIVIHEVTSGIVRRIDVDHLHLTHITLLEQLEHRKVVTFDIEVLGSVPIDRLFRARAKCVSNRTCSLTACFLLAGPSELIHLRSIIHGIIAKKLAKGGEVNYVVQFSGFLVFDFRKARRGNLIQGFKIQLGAIC